VLLGRLHTVEVRYQLAEVPLAGECQLFVALARASSSNV
jgi:hypothetical protein